MISLVIPVAFLWAMCLADDYYYQPANVTRSTLSGIEAYRSALTLDWLAAEDQRQRELAAAFETVIPPPSRTISSDCIGYSRPASGKVARLMLELIKNLEGDESAVVSEMIRALVRSKLLVETSMLDAEPDLDALVKTPGVMMGEPHTTFPRILAMGWMTVTDPVTTKKFGWCPLQKLNKYLVMTQPSSIAKHMRALEPIIARARFIMEEFIQHVTPLNMYDKKSTPKPVSLRSGKNNYRTYRSPGPVHVTRGIHTRTPHVELVQSERTRVMEPEYIPNLINAQDSPIPAKSDQPSITHNNICQLFLTFFVFVL